MVGGSTPSQGTFSPNQRCGVRLLEFRGSGSSCTESAAWISQRGLYNNRRGTKFFGRGGMNFINKIIKKPSDGEPDLKQAHTGQNLQAYFDDKLKRWVFPGEVYLVSHTLDCITFRKHRRYHKKWFHHP